MAQTFYPITPVEVTPGTAGAWTDVDVSAYVPAGATGVTLHFGNIPTEAAYSFGLRKNGSTDNIYSELLWDSHSWAAIGIDANRIFEAWVGSTTAIDIYLVGYTVSGVTFFTNAYDKSPIAGAWTDVNSATEAPNAVGLIFGNYVPVATAVSGGWRMNGSTDNRTQNVNRYHSFGAIIGCDSSQIVELYRANTQLVFYLLGYITDGATFNTNAIDVSLGTAGSWLDLTALPANSVMGFIEIVSATIYAYGLRKNGSTEDIYERAIQHPWAFVEADASYLIEGKIANVAVDFFVVGYATAVALTAVGDTVQGVWNVRVTIADTLQTVWNVLVPIGDTIQSVWNVRAAFGKTVQLIHNVRAVIGDASQHIWNVLAALTAVGDVVQAIWHTRAAVGSTSQSIWNTRLALGKASQHIWNIRQTISQTRQAIWNVRATVSDTLQGLWNVKSTLGKTVESIWHVRAIVFKTVQAIWNVLSLGTYYGILKRWTGTTWVKAKLLVFTGSWVAKPLKRWDGSAWKDVDSTGI